MFKQEINQTLSLFKFAKYKVLKQINNRLVRLCGENKSEATFVAKMD
jgi:hypothetical protein